MPKGLGDVVDTTAIPKHAKGVTHGGISYFPRPKEFSKQWWEEICTELNDVVSVMGNRFKVCESLHDKSNLHLRINCKGMRRKEVRDFIANLKGCGLDTQRDFQPLNNNMSFLGPDSGYYFITVKSLIQGKTFKISDELRTFAENHPPKRRACCNIL